MSVGRSCRPAAREVADFGQALSTVLEEFGLLPATAPAQACPGGRGPAIVLSSAALRDRPLSEFDISLGDASIVDSEVSTLVEGAGIDIRAATPTNDGGYASNTSTLGRNSVFFEPAAAAPIVVGNDGECGVALQSSVICPDVQCSSCLFGRGAPMPIAQCTQHLQHRSRVCTRLLDRNSGTCNTCCFAYLIPPPPNPNCHSQFFLCL